MKSNLLFPNELKMSDGASSKALHIESIFSISHDKDVDGLNAAAIVMRYARSKDLNHEVLLADYGAFEIVFSQVAVLRNALIIVTDLGMDDSVLEVVKSSLKRAISQGCRLVWLDHHQWSAEAIKMIRSLGNKPVLKVNHDYCAAEIAFKVLMPRDAISSELATIAHDTDFNHRKIEGASALTDALSVTRFNAIAKREDMTEAIRPMLVKLADEGLSGVWEDSASRFKDSLLDKQVQNYRKERLKKMRKTLKGHCDQEIHDRLVRIVEAPGGLTTTDLGTFLSDPDNLQIGDEKLAVADLLISMSPGGMLGFRRGHETVLCNAAAKLFNGGGHPYAAGGEYGMYEEFQAVCDDIFLTLSNSKDWIISSPEK